MSYRTGSIKRVFYDDHDNIRIIETDDLDMILDINNKEYIDIIKDIDMNVKRVHIDSYKTRLVDFITFKQYCKSICKINNTIYAFNMNVKIYNTITTVLIMVKEILDTFKYNIMDNMPWSIPHRTGSKLKDYKLLTINSLNNNLTVYDRSEAQKNGAIIDRYTCESQNERIFKDENSLLEWMDRKDIDIIPLKPTLYLERPIWIVKDCIVYIFIPMENEPAANIKINRDFKHIKAVIDTYDKKIGILIKKRDIDNYKKEFEKEYKGVYIDKVNNRSSKSNKDNKDGNKSNKDNSSNKESNKYTKDIVVVPNSKSLLDTKGLANDGTSCYINMALILLDSIPIEYLVKTLIQENISDTTTVIDSLKSSIKDIPSISNTKDIRKYIKDRLDIDYVSDSRQHDPGELLLDILQKTTIPNIDTMIVLTCSCGYRSTPVLGSNLIKDFILYTINTISTDIIEEFEPYITGRDSENYYKHDDFDYSIDHRAIKRTTISFNDFFIVNIIRFDNNNKKLRFIPSIQTTMRIEYSTFQAVCIIDHLGSTPKAGHYIAKIYRNDMWYEIDDDRVNLLKDTASVITKDTYLVLYIKIE